MGSTPVKPGRDTATSSHREAGRTSGRTFDTGYEELCGLDEGRRDALRGGPRSHPPARLSCPRGRCGGVPSLGVPGAARGGFDAPRAPTGRVLGVGRCSADGRPVTVLGFTFDAFGLLVAHSTISVAGVPRLPRGRTPQRRV